jgi:hypothetical protein
VYDVPYLNWKEHDDGDKIQRALVAESGHYFYKTKSVAEPLVAEHKIVIIRINFRH